MTDSTTEALEKRVSKAKARLVLDYPFFGSLALNLNTTITTSAQTAGTDGKRIMYNPDFLKSLNDNEVLFLVAHECLHPALLHIWRRGGRDPLAWNIAADCVINKLLVDERVGTFIKGGVYDEMLFEKGGGVTEQIYDLLPDATGSDHADQIGGIGQDIREGTGTPAEQALDEQEWKIKVSQAASVAKMMGKSSGGLERFVSNILKPRVDWRSVLQVFIQKARNDQRTYARPNRRFLTQNMYTPSITGETMGEILFAVDMSGSIGQDELDQFAAECKTVHEDCKPSKMHMVFFSGIVHAHDTIMPDDGFMFKPRGGGGTAFSPVFQYVMEQGMEPACIVFLTDLECDDFGDAPECPVLWVTTGKTYAPFGEVCQM